MLPSQGATLQEKSQDFYLSVRVPNSASVFRVPENHSYLLHLRNIFVLVPTEFEEKTEQKIEPPQEREQEVKESTAEVEGKIELRIDFVEVLELIMPSSRANVNNIVRTSIMD